MACRLARYAHRRLSPSVTYALPNLPPARVRRSPRRRACFLHLDDEVQHRESRAIRSVLFAQGGAINSPCVRRSRTAVWQSNEGVHFAPVPDSYLVGIAEAEPRHTLLQIKSQSIGLAFCAAVVACIRQHADFQEWKWLELFISGGKAIVLQRRSCRLVP